MSRILLTWELGLNLGHLTRLLPIAERLKAGGHTVLVATRDIQAAGTVLRPAGIPFVQAPHLPKGNSLRHRPAGYADILLSQGWGDCPTLSALVCAWLNLFSLFKPDRAILDYSPTAGLAARIARLPCLLIGNGFELPPALAPLPPFPGFSWATAERAAQSEQLAVANANDALLAFRTTRIEALRDLLCEEVRLLATFPELDHYGARPAERYIGPLLGQLRAPRIGWPGGVGPKIFASLRPDTAQVQSIFTALTRISANVVCVASGFSRAALEPFRSKHVSFALAPVNLDGLLDADFCITYGAEGTMIRFLLAGVPQLISPWHVETYMAARRYEAAALGASVPGNMDANRMTAWLQRTIAARDLPDRARAFANLKQGHEAVAGFAERFDASNLGAGRDELDLPLLQPGFREDDELQTKPSARATARAHA